MNDDHYGSLNTEYGFDSNSSFKCRFLDVSGFCSCRFFEAFGVTCRHLLCVLDNLMKRVDDELLPLVTKLQLKMVHDFWMIDSPPTESVSASSMSISKSSLNLSTRSIHSHEKDELQGYYNNVVAACSENPKLYRQSLDAMKSLAHRVHGVTRGGSGTSSNICVSNMPQANQINVYNMAKSNSAGRKPGSKNNSTFTGRVTCDSDFDSLTNADLVQVLKFNARPYSGKNKEALLEAVRSIPKDKFQSLVINNTTNNESSSLMSALGKDSYDKETLDETSPSPKRNKTMDLPI